MMSSLFLRRASLAAVQRSRFPDDNLQVGAAVKVLSRGADEPTAASHRPGE